MTKKTHYPYSDATRMLREKFLNVSAGAILRVEYSEGICGIQAGADYLIPVSEYDRWVEAIQSAPLVERNGWLVFLDENVREH